MSTRNPEHRKRVLVTGANGHMGNQVATAIAAQGYTVLGLDRQETQLDNGTPVVAGDVTDQESIRHTLENFARDGKLWGVVNCAALIPTTEVWNIQSDDFLRTVHVNTWGTLNVSREAAKFMIEKACPGRIVNVASVAGYIGGLVGGPDYAVSKAGVMVLTKVLAKELAEHRITVNTVAPGALDSPATQVLDAAARSDLMAKIPLQRLGKMEEIAHSVAYLLSEKSEYLTGSTLDVNGGAYLR